MKPFVLFILLLTSINSFSQKPRPYLGWSQRKIKAYLSDDKNIVYESVWKSADDEITCMSYHKKNDPTTAILFYFNKDTDMCFKHSVIMPIDKLPEAIKQFNTIYKREDEAYWKNNSGDTNIRMEYKIGDYFFRINYTNYLDEL